MSQDTTANLSIVAKVDGTDRAASELDRVAAAGARAESGATKATEALKNVGAAGNSAGSGLSSAANGASTAASSLSAVSISANASAVMIGAATAAVAKLGASLGGIADSATGLESRLKLVTYSHQQLADAQQRLFALSQETRTAFDQNVDLYIKFTKGANELHLSQERVVGITKTVAQAMALTGGATESAKAAIMQFGQALSSGVLRGEELNSVLEQAPGLAEALAIGLGRTTGELRTLGAAGKLSVQQLIDALEKAAPAIENDFKSVTPTIAGAATQIENALQKYIHEADKAHGASRLIAGGMSTLASNFNGVADAVTLLAGAGLARLAGAMAQTVASTTAAAVAAEAKRRADIAQAQSAVTVASAELASAQAIVNRVRIQNLGIASSIAVSQANAQLAASTAAASAAQAELAAAQGVASLSSKAAAGALALLGGPIGAITVALGVGATAWAIYGKSGENALAKLGDKIEETEARLRRLKLKKTFGDGDLGDARADLDKEEQRLQSFLGGPTSPAVIAQQRKLVEEKRQLVDELEKAQSTAGETGGSRYRQYMDDTSHFSKQEKLKKELDEENKKFAEATANLEKNSSVYEAALSRHIKNVAEINRAGEDKSGAAAAKRASDEAKREAERQQERLNGLLEVGSGVSKTYAADVTLLGKALASGKITTEEYSAAASKLWKTQTESGKAWEASADAADKANKALNVWKAEHESQLASITEETSAVGQNAAARKVALAGLQVEADARKKIEQLSLNLSETDRAAAVASINAERDKQKALVETALRKQQAVEGAYQLEQENRRFAAESILDEKQRAQVILDIDAETWRQRIDLAEVGSEERRRLEGAFAQWYSNQLSKPAIESMRKALESIDATFHDSFTRMLENGKADWDAFGKALATSFKTAVADEIYKLTIKPIVVSVVSSFAGGAAQAAGAAAGQSGSGIGGVVQGVQAAYGAYNSGISNAATAFATSGVGQYMGLSTTSAAGAMGPPTAEGAYGYTAGGTALTSSGSSFVSSAGPYAAALAALIYGDNLMKAGWGLDNNRKGYAASAVGATAGGVIAGMAAGASSGASAGSTVGPWGTVIGAVVGAIAVPVLSRLFGHNRNTNADATGVQGTFDLSGFTGDQWQQFSKKGGTFRSDRRWTDTFDVTSDIDKALDSSFTQAVAKMQDMGKTLGVEAVKSIEGFQHTFSLQLSDNGDMSKAGEKLAAEITKAADEIAARMIPNIDEFKRLGETASQTFERLNSEVEGTNAILLAMGKDAAAAFGGVGLASIAARENLIDLAGGLDKLSSKTQSYYGSFYSSDEQLQRAADQAQKALDTGFADLGKSVPASKLAFRELVESQDLSTEAGRKLFNSLLDLSDEFDIVSKRSDFLAGLTTAARTQQGSIFDTFASDAQKLEAAKKIVNDTFASIGKAVPDSAEAFLSLAQSIDPATEAGQGLIAALAKVSNAFAYVEKSVADTAAGITAAANAAAASRRSVMDSYDPASAVTRAQADINAAFAKYGATAPTDRAGLAAVAQSIDTNTALGREQMAALQALTGSFDTVFAARSQATSSQRSLQDSFDPAGAVARAQSDITVAFGKYGATAPTDRAGVAAVASSIDTNTALGKQQMAELAALSGAFDTVFGAQERAAQAAADAAQKAADEQARAAKDALDAAQRAADEQARIAQQAAEEQMRLATQVHDSISSALKSLLGQSQQFEAQSRQMAQATLQSALVIAKAGGSLTNFQGLDAALETVTKLDKATFATATSYAVEFGRTANLLTQLEQYTRINGSHANGLDYVPFDGYIAQLHRGERVQTAASAAAADATVEEVKALRSDLNAIGAALAAYTQKTAKLMAKFDVEGIATRA